jgi:hypothetical protein
MTLNTIYKYLVIYTWLKVLSATKIQVQKSKILLLMVCGIQNNRDLTPSLFCPPCQLVLSFKEYFADDCCPHNLIVPKNIQVKVLTGKSIILYFSILLLTFAHFYIFSASNSTLFTLTLIIKI